MIPVSSAMGMKSSGEMRPELGMLPPQQRLEPHHRVAAQFHHRLVEHPQLVALDGVHQIRLEAQPVVIGAVGRRIEDLVAVAAGRLGPVHGHVGVAQQVLGRPRSAGHPDTGRHRDVAPADGERVAQGLEDAPGHPLAAVGLAHGEDGELVAPQPGQGVVAPQGGRQPPGHGHQQLVARARGPGCRSPS